MSQDTNSKDLGKNLLWYAAAAGVALAAPAADAQIVYVDLDPDVCSVLGSNPLIDFDGDTVDDVTIVHNTYAAYGYYGDLNFVNGAFVAASSAGYYAQALSSGATISSAQMFGNGLFSALFGTGYSVGQWLGGLTAFVGFQFVADSGGAATNHFAWMRVAVPGDHSQVCVEDYAYESTPDAAIDAGAMPVAIEPLPDGTPGTHNLSSIYPNPFNPQAQFSLEIAEQQEVSIAVFDALGREVAMLHDGTLNAGTIHQFQIDGSNLPSGVYVVRATGEHFTDVRQVTLTK